MNDMKSIRFPPPVADDMVRAILAGRKTVTRRVVKPQPKAKLAYCCMGHGHGKWSYPVDDAWKNWDDESFRLPDVLTDEDKKRHWTPPLHTGNILYVRETWLTMPTLYTGRRPTIEYLYKADMAHPKDYLWHPSIHMPRKAARIFLRVTGVRVERLQDITDEEAVKEGFEAIPYGYPCTDCMNTRYLDPAMFGFVEAWNNTIKPADRALYGWDANPWVWVIRFERISREEVTP